MPVTAALIVRQHQQAQTEYTQLPPPHPTLPLPPTSFQQGFGLQGQPCLAGLHPTTAWVAGHPRYPWHTQAQVTAWGRYLQQRTPPVKAWRL